MKRAWWGCDAVTWWLVRLLLIPGLFALVSAGVSTRPVGAKTPIVVRVTAGEHPHFGRVVLNAPGLSYTVSRDSGHVQIRFSEEPILGELPPTPRNVLAIRAVSGGVELTVPPGANVRTTRIGDKVVVDIDDTVPDRRPPADGRETPKRDTSNTAANNAETSPSRGTSAPESAHAGAVRGDSAALSQRPAAVGRLTPGASTRVSAPTENAALANAVPADAAPANAARDDAMSSSGVSGGVVRGNLVSGNAVAGNTSPGTALPRNTALRSAAPQNAGSGDAVSGKAMASAAVPGIATFDAGAGGFPQRSEVNAAPPPERPAGPELSGKVSFPAERHSRLEIGAREQGQARSDSAGSTAAKPASFAPGGPEAAPEPRGAESRASADAAAAQQKPHGIAGVDPAVDQTTAPPPVSPDGRPDGHPGQPSVGQSPAMPRVRPEGMVPAQQGPMQVWPVTGDAIPSGPAALVAIKARPPGGLGGVAIRIPFTGAVGAALFSRGSDSFVVFDEHRPIDFSALHDDPIFGSAVVTVYSAATVIRLTRPRGQSAMLFPARLGWRLSIVPTSPKPTALMQDTVNGVMTFAAGAPGQVVAIADPRTGGTLLVGTQRISGQGVVVERRTPEFTLPDTGQGIVVEPLSDAISLRITQAGFVLSGPPAGLALSPAQPMAEATMAAARLTRLFEFPRQNTENLSGRAKRQAVAAATAPLLTRGPRRQALAESMLGLGLGAEAGTVLRVTEKDDPREAASPVTIGLAAIASLLAGRPGEAGDLADPRLTGTDEVALWRAIQTAMSDDASPAAAAVFATTAPLLFTYPRELRRRVLPLVLETMIRGGQGAAAAPLLAQREHDPDLDYARAMLKQAQGDNDEALKLFDALTNTRSTLDHARAATRATELRLAMGQLDNKAAADALEAHLYAWRGDRRDLSLRLRIAELRETDGEWRAVFAMLRGAKADFPGQAVEIDRRLAEAFAAVPRDPSLDKTVPTELIALLDENAELMADGPDGEPMRVLLADKLMALDLPKQADPLLTRLLRAAPNGPARAGFGATLATLRLREGDADGAILALSESNSADMGDAVRERRALILARVEAKRGNISEALATLSNDQTPEADEARAEILEQAQDWPAARDALAVLAAGSVPDSGMLNAAQLQVVLRLATAATRADDDATLASLREKLRMRVGSGPQADMFRLLTEEPVRGTADLPRARAEMGLARAVTPDTDPKKSAAKTP